MEQPFTKKTLTRGVGLLKLRHFVVGGFFIAALGLGVTPAFAVSFTESGPGEEGASLSASAQFGISGDVLTITLTNTAVDDDNGSGKHIPGNTLTGLLWDWAGSPVFTPDEATITAGSLLVQFATCSTGLCTATTTDVGGEFAFNTGVGGFGFAIGSAGWIDLYLGNFNGPNLDDPNAPNGINFGIIGPGVFNPNGGLDDEPLIRNSVTFTLTVPTGLDVSDISNVVFKYGTDDLPAGTIPPIPEPPTMFLFGSGLVGLVAWRMKKKGAA